MLFRSFNGRLLRQKPVNEVLNEIEKTVRKKHIFFVDNNIVGYGKENEQRAIRLFNGLKSLNKIWLAQASINIADNNEILKQANQGGCRLLIIGLESINESALKQMSKTLNLKKTITGYKQAIKKIHDYGILVYGTVIFGNDTDDKDIFKKTADFYSEAGVDIIAPSSLTPLPGTSLHERLTKDNRILHTDYPEDWSKYMNGQICCKPKNMSIKDLFEGTKTFYNCIYNTQTFLKRWIRTLSAVKNFGLSLISLATNLIWKQAEKRKIQDNARNIT